MLPALSAGGAHGEQTGAFYGPKTEEEFYEILVTALSPSLLPSISIFSPLKYQPFLPWTISLTAQTSSSDFSQGQYIVVAHIPRPNVFLYLALTFV